MRKSALIFLLLFSIATGLHAQQVRSANSARIYHELAQLKHLANVLYVAAHPDDENTRLLAWLVNDKNIHTAYLSLTRGDGGQNILGSEQGEALGLIRTHELMEARKIDGAEQYFTRAIDFGFSKNFDETFRHWNPYILTGDVVWAMRKFRPDVVICRFPPNTLAGHGQHAASAILAAKAFKMAGDKLQYTEQLQYYPAWQPKRLLWNTFKFGDRNTTSEDQLKLSVGRYLPLLGMGSGELAGISRSIHKSQGAGTPSVAGVQTEYFKLVDGDSCSASFFDGIDITWNRVGRPEIGDAIQNILDSYDFRHPDASLPALLALRKNIETVKDSYWRNEKLEELDHAIMDCSGLLMELYAKQPQAVRGATVPFTLHIIARSHTPVKIRSVQWTDKDTLLNINAGMDSMVTLERKITIPQTASVTEPYWLSHPHTGNDLYAIPNDSLLGLPETPPELNAMVKVKIGDANMTIPVPLSYKKTDPVKGDVVEPLRIVPDVSISFATGLLIARQGEGLTIGIRLHAFKDIKDAKLVVASENVIVTAITGIYLSAGTDTTMTIQAPEQAIAKMGNQDFYLSAALSTEGKVYAQSQHLIQYSHLPTLQYFTMPYSKVLKSNWKCTAKRIGYVEGAGDFIPTFLRLAGLEVDVLKESDFADAARLKKYDAIITGIRAVNVEKRMSYWLPVLLQYAQNGGTLIMQYNTLQDLATTQLGPYPFTLTDQRVTEENAKITFDPQSRLLNYPNKIEDADFKDWVQERGLYFASKYDDKYQAPFKMNDAGEQPLGGGTLYTKTGKGYYIYTSLSFSRQLPAGNKGAIRLLMNMLSIGK